MKTRISLLKTYAKNPVEGSSHVAPSEEESIYLSPTEKFKEVQKQDWQIEALIIGSVVLGLTQLPNLIEAYYLSIADIFGSKTAAVELLLNIPFGFLLINLSVVLIVRSLWIIESFGSRNLTRMNALNDVAGWYFGGGVLLFLLFLFSSLFWILIISIMPNDTFLAVLMIVMLNFSGIIGLSETRVLFNFSKLNSEKKAQRMIKYTLIVICPLYYFILKGKWDYILENILRVNTNKKFSRKFELFWFTINSIYLVYLLDFTGIMYFHPQIQPAISSHKSPIRIESEYFTDENVWLFVHTSVLDKTKSKTEMYFGEGESVANKKIDMGYNSPDPKKVELLINGEKKTYDWRLNYQEVGPGLKTYLKASEMKEGFNDVRLKTYRDGRWRVWDFNVYKP
jgi:hypothetical protein